jgi:hypothetical protein
MATKTAGSVIRSMYSYCQKHNVLSIESEKTMREYFARIAKMRNGKKRGSRKKSGTKI